MSPTPTRTRATRVLASLTAGALAFGGLTALDSASAPTAEALGSLGALTVGDGPLGVDVSPDGTLAMVANTDDGTVTVLDVSGPVTVIDTITVGGAPAGVDFTPDGSEAWVSTWSGNTVEVIDVDTLTIIDTINAGNGSWSVTFTADGSLAYVVNYSSASVAVVDTATRTVERTISGLSLPQYGYLNADESTLTLPATNSDIVIRIDLSDDSITSTPVGDFPVEGLLTPAGDEFWVTNSSSDTISILDPETLTVIETIASADSPSASASRRMA